MQSKIAVIGDKGSILGFKAVGFHVFEAEEGKSIAELVSSLVKDEFGILFVTEEILAENMEVIEKYKNDMLPAVIPIPSRNGSLGIGMDNIHRNVERAVGADIFNNEK